MNWDKMQIFGRASELHMPPLEYYRLVRSFNKLIQAELYTEISQHSNDLGNFITLVTPGSDGRREKGSIASPLEIIALVDGEADPDYVMQTVTSILDKIPTIRISKVVEVKHAHSKLSHFKGDPKRVQPSRIADSRLVYGLKEMLGLAKERLGEEILSAPREDIVDKVDKLRRDARKTSEIGRNRIAQTDALHFDLENGVVFYNPEAYQLSFKIGPLRLVQNTLLAETIKHTRRENDSKFISRLASGIVSRLEELEDSNLVNLSKSSVKELTEHYAFFLRLYHRSEQAYEYKGQVAVQLTRGEAVEAARRLKSLQKLIAGFKIERRKKI